MLNVVKSIWSAVRYAKRRMHEVVIGCAAAREP
jgi:hypothetical protein